MIIIIIRVLKDPKEYYNYLPLLHHSLIIKKHPYILNHLIFLNPNHFNFINFSM